MSVMEATAGLAVKTPLVANSDLLSGKPSLIGMTREEMVDALMEIGVPQKQVEAYVLDEDLDLYGHTVEISFVERIRGMVAYAGIDPLIAQIGEDVERARAILTAETA